MRRRRQRRGAGWALARACHPIPALGVTLLVATLGAALGASPARLSVLTAAVLAGQLSVGWTNDLVDRDRDRAQHRVDKPLARGELDIHTVRLAAGSALMACVPLSLALGVIPALAHFTAIGAALAYNAGLKSTAWSWAPYAVAFGLLPVVVWRAVPPYASPPAWAVLAAVLLAVGAHGANVLPDRASDLAVGQRPLPHRLPVATARFLTVAFFVSGTTVLVAGAMLGE